MKSIRMVSISGLGDVAVGTVSWEGFAEARRSAREAEEDQKADVFSDSLLSNILVEPQLSREEIAQLPPETKDALIDAAVDQLGVRQQYERTALSMSSPQRFYTATLEYLRQSFPPLQESVERSIQACEPVVPNVSWNVLENATRLFARLSEWQPALWLPTFQVPAIDPSVWASAFDVSKKIAEAVETATDVYRHVGEQLANQADTLMRTHDAVFRQISANLAAFQMAARQLYVLDVFRELELLRDAAEAFKEAGWPLAPSMPVELRERVVELHRRGKAHYASNTIIGYYRRNGHAHLVAAVDAWDSNPLVGPRIHIIRDALEAHREGRYTLSVPALLPQIEGILCDYVVRHRLQAKLGKVQAVYEAAIGDPGDYAFTEWAITTTLLYQFQTNTYTWTDFAKELRKSAERREVTRHTVVHGINYRYDRLIHSLRAFLTLDAISALQPPR